MPPLKVFYPPLFNGEIDTMRRKDREITDRDTMESILNDAEVCRIALADSGEPYVVPVCFAYGENAIYFHSAPEGKKMEMLGKNPRCCVEVDQSSGPIRNDNPCAWEMRYQSVICTGIARILTDYEEKCAAMNRLLQHYGSPGHAFTEKEMERVCLVKISLDGMTAKQHGY
ncbi:pyridoxamine 5'-phosphate oxidase family protein [Methanoregula sp.]|uniref:pyridoxamine 5'-phosphate oxidase family protein n=1 Tax=Methanoregula sp. TaxID=2052170 RepID=UPI002CCC528D|nr:pyridoxamine 5'-phosphate oxidase family protein [Methanoregula sp.]HVP95743.1 pyridoxamine 5'-phosphate oxidase family protein [Methanoregula sp.]